LSLHFVLGALDFETFTIVDTGTFRSPPNGTEFSGRPDEQLPRATSPRFHLATSYGREAGAAPLQREVRRATDDHETSCVFASRSDLVNSSVMLLALRGMLRQASPTIKLRKDERRTFHRTWSTQPSALELAPITVPTVPAGTDCNGLLVSTFLPIKPFASDSEK